MLPEQAAVQLTARFQATLGRISTRAGRLTAAEWDALGSWNEADIARFASRTEPVFVAAKEAAVNASAGYYSILGELPTPALDAAAITVPVDVRAPFAQAWHELTQGQPWVDAIASGQNRASSLATNLVTSTSRLTGGVVLGSRVVGWRRVLTGKSCTWCGTVATQRYKSAESADFGHDHCDCTVAPIYGESDPGQVINARRVAAP